LWLQIDTMAADRLRSPPPRRSGHRRVSRIWLWFRVGCDPKPQPLPVVLRRSASNAKPVSRGHLSGIVRAPASSPELHDERARLLRERFRGEPVVVVVADASDLRLPRRPFRVVANPPFAITTALLRRLLAPGSRLVRADLVVPRHVAERWTSPAAPASTDGTTSSGWASCDRCRTVPFGHRPR